MQKWLPPDMLDLHGYVNPTLIEATTKPHNPSIEYDLWLKWNQARIDANEAAMNAIGQQIQRPINDWCPNGAPPGPTGLCAGGLPGPGRGRGLGRLGPLLHPDVRPARGAQRLDRGDVQQHGVRRPRRLAAAGQYVVSWSTLLFDIANRHDLLAGRARVLPPRRHQRAAPGVLPAAVRRRTTTGCTSTRRRT